MRRPAAVELTPAELDAFLLLRVRLLRALQDEHGAVHARSCGCGHAEQGQLRLDGARWRWWNHGLGVCCERLGDGLAVELTTPPADPGDIDPWHLLLYLRSRGDADLALAEVLAALERLRAAAAITEHSSAGTRAGLRRFRRALA